MITESDDPEATRVADVDPLDPGEAGTIHERWGAVRRGGCPVRHSARQGGFWLVTRYADVAAVARDGDRFSAAVPGLGAALVSPESESGSVAPVFEQDGPTHTRWRRALAPFLSPAAARARGPWVRGVVRSVLGQMRPAGRADLVADLAWRVGPVVTADLLGIPDGDRDEFRRLLRASTTGPGTEDAAAYRRFLAAQARARVGGSGHDLLTVVVNTEIDGRRLADGEVVRFASLMVAAATLTTIDAIGSTLLLLCEDPGLRALVLADPALVSALVEESVRWESPVATTARVATTDVRVGGVDLVAGDRVLLAWGSANRDEAVFTEGEVARVDRAPWHLGWGTGAHQCPGRHLAREVLAVVVREVLDAVPDFRLQDGVVPRWTYGPLRGPEALPVVWSSE
ncbi:cytochrome P450 [Actinokineospora terrae]|nr:cytochrome P450 [Actinokineospora terrae]